MGRPTINKIGAIVSTVHLVMKFHNEHGRIVTVRGSQEAARRCYNASLEVGSEPEEVAMVDLEVRNQKLTQRPEPDGELEDVQIGEEENQTTRISSELPETTKNSLIKCLRAHSDLFAWAAEDMPGVDPRTMSHRLSIYPGAKPVIQKRRKMAPHKEQEVLQQTRELLKAGFIREVQYPTWLSNVVMVPKANGKMRMCVDYTNLNKACPKDPYPLPQHRRTR